MICDKFSFLETLSILLFFEPIAFLYSICQLIKTKKNSVVCIIDISYCAISCNDVLLGLKLMKLFLIKKIRNLHALGGFLSVNARLFNNRVF